MFLIPNSRKYGYIDKKGYVLINFAYVYADSFSEDIAAVTKDAEWSYPRLIFIDKKGKTIEKLSSMNLRGFMEENGETGEITYSFPSFHNDVVDVNRLGNGSKDELKWDDNPLCIDKNGNIVKNADYTNIHSPYMITKVGIVNKDGVLVAKYPENEGWDFPDFEFSNYARFVNVHNGVILAKLVHEPTIEGSHDWDYETTEIYGYVDLEGNTTFTENDKLKIKKAQIENDKREEEWEQRQEDAQNNQNEIEKGPEWINGSWYFRGNVSKSGVTMYFNCRIVIDRNNKTLKSYDGSRLLYSGSYKIRGNSLVYDEDTVIPFDSEKERLEFDRGGYYFSKESSYKM